MTATITTEEVKNAAEHVAADRFGADVENHYSAVEELGDDTFSLTLANGVETGSEFDLLAYSTNVSNIHFTVQHEETEADENGHVTKIVVDASYIN